MQVREKHKIPGLFANSWVVGLSIVYFFGHIFAFRPHILG